ncbi:hypothetical protein B0A48_00195 [Cryoendolithus antarcticus]|uniref:Increased recombination centers protein 6 n=1 Tax=Cryoendolithus antarcticus TaxID=1507870 RepID=A0A1V8TU30_9PEZI|nr:hypothetical protein B0A48_00195 [Cryoendolithus antarcticus]
MPTPRLLLLGSPSNPFAKLLTDLTGSVPPLNSSGSLAGVTHEWDVKTQYYNATVPIWIDEIADIDEWQTEFLRPEAKEVVQAVGAWVYCFGHAVDGDWRETAEKTMKAIQAVVEEHSGFSESGVMLVVGMTANGGLMTEDQRASLDDACMDYGFELVDYGVKGINEFGEKQGFERLKEALETNDWSGTVGDDEEEEGFDFGEEQDDGSVDSLDILGRNEAEVTAELFGLKTSLLASGSVSSTDGDAPDVEHIVQDQAAEVDDLDFMMGKLLAVREQSGDLPIAQRKKAAAKAVQELMSRDVASMDRGNVPD